MWDVAPTHLNQSRQGSKAQGFKGSVHGVMSMRITAVVLTLLLLMMTWAPPAPNLLMDEGPEAHTSGISDLMLSFSNGPDEGASWTGLRSSPSSPLGMGRSPRSWLNAKRMQPARGPSSST